MNPLDEREAFLRAIHANPADNTVRLVYADWLDEHDEAETAEFIRLDIRFSEEPSARQQLDASTRHMWLRNRVYWIHHFQMQQREPPTDRGLPNLQTIQLDAPQLKNEVELRQRFLTQCPHWPGCTHLRLRSGLLSTGKEAQTLLTAWFFENVSHWDLSGIVTSHTADRGDELLTEELYYAVDDSSYHTEPVITLQAVEALVNSREARRIVSLDLTNNNLDNDAARAILNSKQLLRLKTLRFFDGNQLRGRTWAQLQERFMFASVT